MNQGTAVKTNFNMRVATAGDNRDTAAPTPRGVDAEQLYRDHYAAVMRYVRSRVATKDIAEDLVSDVFYRAVGSAGAYQALHETPLPWLYRIAANRVADYYRRRRQTCSLEAASEARSPAPDPLESVVLQAEVLSVWEAARNLPATQRRALWLRYARQLELREIAILMGKSVEAVKLLIHRALKSVRAHLGLTAGSGGVLDTGDSEGPIAALVISGRQRLGARASVPSARSDGEAAAPAA